MISLEYSCVALVEGMEGARFWTEYSQLVEARFRSSLVDAMVKLPFSSSAALWKVSLLVRRHISAAVLAYCHIWWLSSNLLSSSLSASAVD